ncbi:sialidase family protein [Microlunatus sp. Y2014]|uniref:sialidase family protein n=1 Tax=Microlunatus sp. Y2014 TaxID=3418488 RepID=UPI003DA78B5E
MSAFRLGAGVVVASLLLAALPAALPTPLTARADDGDPIPDAGVVVYDQQTAGFECFRIPAIIRAADGALLAFAEARRAFPGKKCHDDGSIDLVVKRSTDRGHTWSEMTTVLAGDPWGRDLGATRGNPSPILFTQGEHAGRIVLLSTYNVEGSRAVRLPFVQYSDDNGHTWSEATDLTDQLKDGLPERGWFATGPQHAIELQHGRHAGRLVVGLSIGYTDEAGASHTYGAIGYSDDGGLTWHRGAMAPPPADADHFSEVGLVEQPNGGVMAIARSRKGEKADSMAHSRVINVSRDGGESFTRKRFGYEPTLLTTAEVQGSVLNMASDTNDAGPVMFYAAPTHPTQRKYLSVFVSTNAGRTWDRRLEVTSDRSGYSDLVMYAQDKLGVLYETGYEDGDARDRITYKEIWTNRLGV